MPLLNRSTERGSALFMVAAAMVVLLIISALAIDLVMLYVTRSEAQRAADSAALAGAKTFISSGYTSGLVTQAAVQAMATAEAITVGAQNQVGGQPAQILNSDVTFDFSVANNPRINVMVQRVAARGNAMNTLFARVVGVTQSDVSAVATAEAFNPSGGSIPIGTSCVKPWILPNCDPDPGHGGSPTACTVKFVDTAGNIVNPGAYPAGVIGQHLVLKPGTPSQAAAPSQFYPIQIPPGTTPAQCPACASSGGGSSGPGAALYRANIACCNTNQLVCGQQVDIDLQTGNMVGPTRQGTECLIHQLPQGGGQDTIDTSVVPFQITGGTNNPNPALINQLISTSDSIVTIPMYDGHQLCPGGSCGFTVTVEGFMQVFIQQVDRGQQGTVEAIVLNVAGCGAGGSGSGGGGSGGPGGGTVIGSGGGLFPVRLIRTN